MALMQAILEHRSHIIDSVFSLVCFVVATAALDSLEPTHLQFDPNDPDISYKNTAGTVTSLQLSLISFAAPFVIIVVIHFGYRHQERTKNQLITRVCCLWYTIGLTSILTNIIKISLGELRPDFLDRCKPMPNSTICTGNEQDVRDGRKSFPSGHASYSFAGCMFITIILLQELKPYSLENIRRAPYIRFCASTWPLVIAALVGVSRVTDNRHHPHDVIVGSVLGIVVAIICSYLYKEKNPNSYEKARHNDHDDSGVGTTLQGQALTES